MLAKVRSGTGLLGKSEIYRKTIKKRYRESAPVHIFIQIFVFPPVFINSFQLLEPNPF